MTLFSYNPNLTVTPKKQWWESRSDHVTWLGGFDRVGECRIGGRMNTEVEYGNPYHLLVIVIISIQKNKSDEKYG